MQTLDLDALKIQPFYERFQGYRTKLGGSLTLSLIFIAIACAWAFGKELFEKKSPFVVSSEVYDENPFFNKTLFKVAFRSYILDEKIKQKFGYKDPDKFVSFFLMSSNTSSSRVAADPESDLNQITKIETTECVNTELYQKNLNHFDKYILGDITDYKCLSDKETNNTDYSLVNKIGSAEFTSFHVGMTTCMNNTLQNDCATQEDIDELVNNLYLHLVITNNFIDSSNLTSPIQSTYFNKLFKLQSGNLRRDVFYYKTFDYLSDEGMITPSNTKHVGAWISRYDSEFFYTPENPLRAEIILSLEQSKVTYQRTYTKLQKVAADVGGMLKICTVVIGIISNKYAYVHFYDSIYSKYETEKVTKRVNKVDPKHLEMLKDAQTGRSNLNMLGNNKSSRIHGNDDSISQKELEEDDVGGKGNKRLDNEKSQISKVMDISNTVLTKKVDKQQIKNQENNKKKEVSFGMCFRYHSNINFLKTQRTITLRKMEAYYQNLYSLENIVTVLEEHDILKKVMFGTYEMQMLDLMRLNTKKKIDEEADLTAIDLELMDKLDSKFSDRINMRK